MIKNIIYKIKNFLKKINKFISIVFKKNKYSILTLLFLTILSSINLNLLTTYAKDNEENYYYSHLPDEEIKKIFNLELGDITYPWNWISDTKTYVVLEKTELGNINYWWNTPNIQMSAQNSLSNIVASSGYGNGPGINPKDREWLVDLGDSKKANTAMKKYGFNIPNPTYVGERPLITISIMGVLLPDGIWDTAGRIWDLVFDGDIVQAPTDEDLNSLAYAAPRDYNTEAGTFQKWVDKYWYEAMDSKDGIPEGQILVTGADDEGRLEKDGQQWIKKFIIDEQGLTEPDLSAKEICSLLSEICGKHYPDVAKNILASAAKLGIGETHNVERIMPYDLSRMNSTDKEMFDSIEDPRAKKQEGLWGTGYDNVLTNILKSFLLNISGKMAEITVSLNGVTNFTFIENIGLDPTILWNSSITQLLITTMFCAFIFYAFKTCFKVFKNGNYMSFALKTLCTFLMIILVYNISRTPDDIYKFIKNSNSVITNLTSFSFNANDNINSLYGTGDTADKENVRLWLPYFNIWTKYHTNHNLTDSSQIINEVNDAEPERKGLKIPKIDGKEQKLWSTVLAEDFTKYKAYSGNIYRVVDHFMAPRITEQNFSDEDLNVEVKRNENWNGYIQSSINFAIIPLQVLIFLYTIFKVALFFEFLYNIATFLYNLTLSVTSGKRQVWNIIKELFASMLNVNICTAIIGLIVWTTITADTFLALIMTIFYFFLSISTFKKLYNSYSVFTPKFFRPLKKAENKVKSLFM